VALPTVESRREERKKGARTGKTGELSFQSARKGKKSTTVRKTAAQGKSQQRSRTAEGKGGHSLGRAVRESWGGKTRNWGPQGTAKKQWQNWSEDCVAPLSKKKVKGRSKKKSIPHRNAGKCNGGKSGRTLTLVGNQKRGPKKVGLKATETIRAVTTRNWQR